MQPQVCSSSERLKKKFRELDLPEAIVDDYEDCARFLIDSSLIYSMIGYLETSGDPDRHGLKQDDDGHPLIYMQGEWTRWEDIKGRLDFEREELQIVSKDDPSEKWNYFSEKGLVPIDRFHYDAVFPIHQLSEQEHSDLVEHAHRFYETNLERDEGIEKDCVVQFFTTPRRQGIPDKPYLANLHRFIPVHVGMRLITQDRHVYSFGFEMTHTEMLKVNSNMRLHRLVSTFFKTAPVYITMRDYEEFHKHEGRVVTSIPVTSTRALNIIDRLNALNKQGMRFQFGRQNCTSLMHEVLQEAGYDVDVRTSIGRIFFGLFPNADQLPWIGPLLGKIQKTFQRAWRQCVRGTSVFSWLERVVFYIPRKAGLMLSNLLAWKLGASECTSLLADGMPEERLYDKKGIQSFSKVIRSPKDMLDPETSAINHPCFFQEWQNKQHSTFVHPPGRPKLCIVPTF
jgi:Domain of unknown function (DUF4105)